MATPTETLEDPKINVRLKIAGAWIALLLLYAYGDIIAYFQI